MHFNNQGGIVQDEYKFHEKFARVETGYIWMRKSPLVIITSYFLDQLSSMVWI